MTSFSKCCCCLSFSVCRRSFNFASMLHSRLEFTSFSSSTCVTCVYTIDLVGICDICLIYRIYLSFSRITWMCGWRTFISSLPPATSFLNQTWVELCVLSVFCMSRHSWRGAWWMANSWLVCGNNGSCESSFRVFRPRLWSIQGNCFLMSDIDFKTGFVPATAQLVIQNLVLLNNLARAMLPECPRSQKSIQLHASYANFTARQSDRLFSEWTVQC